MTNKVDVYARRLGVLPQEYAFALGYAQQRLTGHRPSLKEIGRLLDEARLREWDRSKAAFRAARAAREWAYFSDPLRELQQVENDREALRWFERQKGGSSSRKQRKRKRNNKNRNHAQARPVRRSKRRKHKKRTDDLYWNYQDKYVLDMDEHTAATTRTMNTVSMTVARRKTKLCKLV